MEEADVLRGAFAMPRTSPSCPPGPYRHTKREHLTLAYRTDGEAARRLLPEPLVPLAHQARLQFIRSPDSTGFGEYALVLQSLPCRLPDGESGHFVVGAHVNAHTANSGGRELWGFPQKLARPSLRVERDTLLGALDFGPVPVARASMGFEHRALDEAEGLADIAAPGVLLKIIPHVDGGPRICQLVRHRITDVVPKGGWTGPAARALAPHALAPVADLSLGLGEVVHDHLDAKG